MGKIRKEEPTIGKINSSDKERMMLLFKHYGGFTEEQQDFIWQMLKKYIDPAHPRPIANCDCPMSFGNAFNKLRDWVSING